MSRRPDPATQRRWLQLILRWRRSGLPVRTFCERHQLSEPNFYFWRRLLRQRGLLTDAFAPAEAPTALPAFVQLEVQAQRAAEPAPALELLLPQGCVLRVPAGFDPGALRQVLAVLRERPC